MLKGWGFYTFNRDQSSFRTCTNIVVIELCHCRLSIVRDILRVQAWQHSVYNMESLGTDADDRKLYKSCGTIYKRFLSTNAFRFIILQQNCIVFSLEDQCNYHQYPLSVIKKMAVITWLISLMCAGWGKNIMKVNES